VGQLGNPGDVPGDQRADFRLDRSNLARARWRSDARSWNSRVILETSAADRTEEFGRGPVDRPRTKRCVLTQPALTRGLSDNCAPGRREEKKPLVPGGKRFEWEVPLNGTEYAVPAGTSGSSGAVGRLWPKFWPSPGADDVKPDHEGISQIGLRVSASRRSGSRIACAVSAEPIACHVLRQGRARRSVRTDPVKGKVTHRRYVDGGRVRRLGQIGSRTSVSKLGSGVRAQLTQHPDDNRIPRAQTMTRRTTWSRRLEDKKTRRQPERENIDAGKSM